MGKTTLLRGIVGLLPRQAGQVALAGEALPDGHPHRVAERGIAYAPQEQAVFQDLTIEQNLRIAVPDRQRLREGIARIAGYFPFIGQRLAQKAGTLSGGEQKMLILGRALIARPRLLLLDEITEGLQPSVIERICTVLQAERRSGEIAMLIVEQNVAFALKTTDRFAVLERGELVEQGRTDAPEASRTILRRLGV
jgi:branched-chain amino acid transport system ATP-binding protein